MNALTLFLSRSHRALLSVAIVLAVGSAPAHAQEMDHSKPPATSEPPAQKPAPQQETPAESMDHSAMGHEMPMTAVGLPGRL